MSNFLFTSHLSEILEKSEKEPVIIFKFSKTCHSSSVLENEFKKNFESKKITSPVYKITVQDTPEISRKIEQFFEIKHESPQVIRLYKNKIDYVANHHHINLGDIAKN